MIPGVADNAVWSAALAFAERKRAFVILDPPVQAVADPSSNRDLPPPKLPLIEEVVKGGHAPASLLLPPRPVGAGPVRYGL